MKSYRARERNVLLSLLSKAYNPEIRLNVGYPGKGSCVHMYASVAFEFWDASVWARRSTIKQTHILSWLYSQRDGHMGLWTQEAPVITSVGRTLGASTATHSPRYNVIHKRYAFIQCTLSPYLPCPLLLTHRRVSGVNYNRHTCYLWKFGTAKNSNKKNHFFPWQFRKLE